MLCQCWSRTFMNIGLGSTASTNNSAFIYSYQVGYLPLAFFYFSLFLLLLSFKTKPNKSK